MSSAQDRLGIRTFPLNRPGFHTKNNTTGTTLASQYENGTCEAGDSGDSRKNAGNIVIVGIGQVSVGRPLEKQPIHATSSSTNPTAMVWYTGFMQSFVCFVKC